MPCDQYTDHTSTMTMGEEQISLVQKILLCASLLAPNEFCEISRQLSARSEIFQVKRFNNMRCCLSNLIAHRLKKR